MSSGRVVEVFRFVGRKTVSGAGVGPEQILNRSIVCGSSHAWEKCRANLDGLALGRAIGRTRNARSRDPPPLAPERTRLADDSRAAGRDHELRRERRGMRPASRRTPAHQLTRPR